MSESPLTSLSLMKAQELAPSPMQTATAGLDQNAARFSALMNRSEPSQRNARENSSERSSRDEPRDASVNADRRNSTAVTDRAVHRREGKRDGEGGDDQQQRSSSDRLPQESAWSPSNWFASIHRSAETIEAPTPALRSIDELVEAAAAAIQTVQSGDETSLQVTVKDDVLPGVEIEIERGAEGIKISVTASNAGSFDLLSEHKDALLERLNETLQQPVSVEIQFESASGGFEQPSDRGAEESESAERRQSDRDGDSDRRRRDERQQDDAEESQS